MRIPKRVELAAATLLFSGTALAGPPEDLQFFLEINCYTCHGDGSAEGGLDFTKLSTDLTDPAVQAKWVRVHDRVRNGEMPPSSESPPEAGEKSEFLGLLAEDLVAAHEQTKGTVIRRLNRVEYENTLNDLLGVQVEVTSLLPEDGSAAGFDNVGEALDISSVQLERYLEAAGIALEAATRRVPRPETELVDGKLPGPDKATRKAWLYPEDGRTIVFSDGKFPHIEVQGFRAPIDATYRVRLDLAAYQSEAPIACELWTKSAVRNGPSFQVARLNAQPAPVGPETVEVFLRAGEGLRFMTPGVQQKGGGPRKVGPEKYDGPGVAFGAISIEGPLFEEWPGRGHSLLFGQLTAPPDHAPKKGKGSPGSPTLRTGPQIESGNPEEDIERLLPGFVASAFRRPVTEAETAPYRALAKQELANGSTFEEAMRTAQIAVLCSPQFLYLQERPGKLDDFALASRLSYFFWSTLPDQELLDLAAAGRLSDPAVLRQQTERLLKDPRSERFTDQFTGQWLGLRMIDDTTPDKKLYPEFDDALQAAMVAETRLFFEEVLDNNLSVLEFIDSDWTYANARLAEHYGIDGVKGSEMIKVALRPEHRRGGVMTHGSVLKVSANGATTSPVLRGTWVLERLLGVHPPPPPPGIPGVEPDIRGASTVRELLEKHRNLESCQGCHQIIDPPGFALESYDVIGGWRENYRSLGEDFPKPEGKRVPWRIGPAVDASGETIDGQAFSDLDEFKAILLQDPHQLAHAVTEKLAVYATGRPMGFSDRAEIDRIVHATEDRRFGMRDIIYEIIQSPIFQNK